jgi:nicotinamide-nucleotide amidase
LPLGPSWREGIFGFVHVELINTGSELMLGRVLNTHQQWLCRNLADLGYLVSRQVAVADTGPHIGDAIRESLARSDLVITTGGLGPTSDDITRDHVAQLLGKRLLVDQAVLADIKGFFEKRKRAMPDATRVQALVPEGGIVLRNAYGTAPGLAIEVAPNPFREGQRKSWLIMLPGPPREMRPMFAEVVRPLLTKMFTPPAPFFCRTLRSTGIGESVVEEQIAADMQPLISAGLEIGYCSRPGEVDVRFSAIGTGGESLVTQAAKLARDKLGKHIFGEGDIELPETVVRLLTEKRQTLALAESCTGGSVSNAITNVPGASAVLLAGLVTYSNQAKQRFLGVRAETLSTCGAVSEPVAMEMAEGARLTTGASYALSITGIAGPTGGTPVKPVGTVFIGLAGPGGISVVRNVNPFDRATFKQVTTQQALELLRQELVGGHECSQKGKARGKTQRASGERRRTRRHYRR